MENSDNELLMRTEQAEARVKELETALIDLSNALQREQERYKDYLLRLEKMEAEMQDAQAEMKSIRTDSEQMIQAITQKYSDSIDDLAQKYERRASQLEAELECLTQLFASTDLSVEEKLNIWILRQRHRREKGKS